MTTAPSIFLVGMMGAGKSTIGRLLADAIGFEFIDADRELEARSGVPVPTIFEIEGEAGFRRREAALLDELTLQPGVVLATGGGAVLEPLTRQRLRERGLVIYLRTSADEVHRRTRRDKNRPLLRTGNPRERIEQLLTEREPLYEEVAHVTVQSAASNPKKLLQRLVAHPEVRAVAELAAQPGAE
ncbi:MAG TPA: shikimate kinase [Burkholderiaceae bacterium]|nr:shikimate kinase [Burkholderiaceae bacterium]